MKTVKVTLREKPISKGRKSLYLDFYPPVTNPETGKSTRRDFLGLYILEKPKTAIEKNQNKETLILAQSICARRQIEIYNGTYGFSSNTKRKKDFLEYYEKLMGKRYQSEGNYGNWKSALKHLRAYLPDSITMGEIDKTFVLGFKDYLEYSDLKQNSKISYFRKLGAALKQAVFDGYLKENPMKQVKGFKEAETKREFLTLEEIKLLINTDCDLPLYKRAFIFSAFTGLRFSDIKALTWGDVQESEGNHFIRFQQKKTKGHQTLPLPDIALKQLGERKDHNTPLFKGMSYSAWMNAKIKLWVVKAGINKHITFHCARHSFATLQLTLGTDIYTVSKLLGHKEIRTTQIYANIVDEKKSDAIDKLNNLDL